MTDRHQTRSPSPEQATLPVQTPALVASRARRASLPDDASRAGRDHSVHGRRRSSVDGSSSNGNISGERDAPPPPSMSRRFSDQTLPLHAHSGPPRAAAPLTDVEHLRRIAPMPREATAGRETAAASGLAAGGRRPSWERLLSCLGGGGGD